MGCSIMPISLDEVKKGRTKETMESIVENFLEQHKGQAFKEEEITGGVYSNLSYDPNHPILSALGAAGAVLTIENALNNLIREGRVSVQSVKEKNGTEKYYWIP